MHEFEHKHVVTLRGVCLDGGPAPYIIMPFMANGSLLAYLKKNRETLIVSSKEQDEVNLLGLNSPQTIYNQGFIELWLDKPLV